HASCETGTVRVESLEVSMRSPLVVAATVVLILVGVAGVWLAQEQPIDFSPRVGAQLAPESLAGRCYTLAFSGIPEAPLRDWGKRPMPVRVQLGSRGDSTLS